MSLSDNIDYQVVSTAGSFNLDTESNVHYFTASADITYNLSAITCDEIKFKVYRFDTRNECFNEHIYVFCSYGW